MISDINLLMKGRKTFLARMASLPDLTYKSGICDQSPSIHKAFCIRELPRYPYIIFFGKKIPVITKGKRPFLICLLVSLKSWLILIEILTDPWMDDQFLYRILLIYRKKCIPLFFLIKANPCFYGNLHVRQPFIDPFQKTIQLQRKAQKA